MAEASSSKDLKSTEFDYASFGQKLSSDPVMIEVASLFYSPRELVDIFYLCAQHQAGTEHVKKREEEFDQMLYQKARERYNEAVRKSKGRLKVGETEVYRQNQITSHKLDIATEMLRNRKEVLDRITRKRAEIENEIKRLKAILEDVNSDEGESRTAP